MVCLWNDNGAGRRFSSDAHLLEIISLNCWGNSMRPGLVSAGLRCKGLQDDPVYYFFLRGFVEGFLG